MSNGIFMRLFFFLDIATERKVFYNFLSFTNLKNVPLDTPIKLAASRLVNSLD